MAPPPPASRTLLPRILVSLALIALLLGGGAMAFRALAGLRKETVRKPHPAALPTVRVALAIRGPYREQVAGYGQARALRQSEVAAQVQGLIAWVDEEQLQAGAAVQAAPLAAPGPERTALPVLVRIQTDDLDGRVQRVQAEVQGAGAELHRLEGQAGSWEERLALAREELAAAEREFDRIEPLVPKTLSRSDLDRQQLQVALRRQQVLSMSATLTENADAVAGARSRTVSLEQDLAQARRDLARASIRAPFGGRVVSRAVFVGDYVRVGDPLFSIMDLSSVEVALALPASRYPDVQAGAGVVLRDTRSGEVLYRGTVTRVAPGVQPEARTFLAYVQVPGTPDRAPVPPGTHVLGEVEGALHEAVIAVPRSAFLGDQLLVVDSGVGTEREVHAVRPTVLRLLPAVALISAGLEEGESYLMTNLESVSTGSRVQVVTAEDEQR